MSFPSVNEQMAILRRGCVGIYSEDDLTKRLEAGRKQNRPLRVKLGLDPTAPDIHLGHTVVLRKMRQFQDLGHQAVLIIGDFTARIGDPSGRSKTRPMLDEPTIRAHAETYFQQAGRILDTAKDKLEVRYNSEWLDALDLPKILKLTGMITVDQMLQRENFKLRRQKNIEIIMTELMYPLMQAYDSVMIDADVELGGTDQTFNNLVGRDVMPKYGKPPQIVMVLPILCGLDGVEKMSKSLGNTIGLTDTSKDMFGKTMSIADAMMADWFTLLTSVPAGEITTLVDAAVTHPRDAKVRLAKEIVAQYFDRQTADHEESLWQKVMVEGGLRDDIPTKKVYTSAPLIIRGRPGRDEDPERVVLTSVVRIANDGRKHYLFDRVDLIRQCDFASSNSEARRLMAQKGIRLNGSILEPENKAVEIRLGDILKRGKRQAVRLQPELRESQDS